MTRRIGDTERRPRLNPNAQNVFFMRVESIVILEFCHCSWNELSLSKPRGGHSGKIGKDGEEESINWWLDGQLE